MDPAHSGDFKMDMESYRRAEEVKLQRVVLPGKSSDLNSLNEMKLVEPEESVEIKVEPVVYSEESEEGCGAEAAVDGGGEKNLVMTGKTPTQRSRPNTFMTDKDRIALCEYSAQNPKLAQKDLIQWLQQTRNVTVSQGTVSNTLKRKGELLRKAEEEENLQTKRQRSVKYPLMESALIDWFKLHRGKVTMSGEVVKEMAAVFLDQFYRDHPPFEFSNGWLEGFKSRHGIRFHRRFSDSGSMGAAVVRHEALLSVSELLDCYESRDIYNMDETGLFYRIQADNSLAERAKDQVTVTVCCNGDGSHKLPLWVIGRFRTPRCFKNVNRGNLGCVYRSNEKAKMTWGIFLEWLKDFDRKVTDRQVLLLLDNCAAHVPPTDLPSRVQLKNTRVLYLPPNTTSFMQPSDAGIVRNLKAYYRRRFNRLLLQRLDDGEPNPEKISILEAIGMVVPAWSFDVKRALIRNCFAHCKLRLPVPDSAVLTEEDLLDRQVVEDLENQIRRLNYADPMDVGRFCDYPAEQDVAYLPQEEDVAAYPQVDHERDDDSEDVRKVTMKEALRMLETLETFWLQQKEESTEFVAAVQKMKDKLELLRIQQPAMNFTP